MIRVSLVISVTDRCYAMVTCYTKEVFLKFVECSAYTQYDRFFVLSIRNSRPTVLKTDSDSASCVAVV